MDFFKQQFLGIQQQFGGLTLTQRMLAASLVAIMVMTVLYWGRYASTPDMVAIFDQGFAPDKATRMLAVLEGRGIKATVNGGGQILVPTDKMPAALSAVAFNRLQPSNSSDAVDKIVSQMTMWDPATKTDRLFNEKRQLVLAQTIAQFPGVEDATVQIDPAERKSFSAPSQPRASIFIKMRENERPSKKLVLAAADWVVGAQAGLSRTGVNVIVDGVSFPLQDRDNGAMLMSGEILETKQGFEKHFADKIREQLANIPNVFVAVTVEVNTRRTEQQTSAVDPKNIVNQPLSSMTQTSKTSQTSQAAGDPGAVPNAGVALPTSGGQGGGMSNSNQETTSFRVDYGTTRTTTFQPAGDGTVTAASVRVPRSHFIKIWRLLNPKANEDPDEATLGSLMSGQLTKIRRDVMACTGLKDEASVMVDFYVDAEPAPLQAGSGSGAPVLSLVGSYGKEVALGVMALIAMFMVTGLVKKGSGGVPASAAVVTPEEQREIERLAGGEEVAGSVQEWNTTLEALELDEETSQTQQMVSQVSNMVKENPDAAVSLVKRWMNRV